MYTYRISLYLSRNNMIVVNGDIGDSVALMGSIKHNITMEKSFTSNLYYKYVFLYLK